MAYCEDLAKRISFALNYRTDVVEKKMFGGLAYMINGKMSVGIIKDELMVRVIPAQYEAALQLPFAKEMDFTGRVMKGFVQVEKPGFETEEQLQEWLETGIEFAQKAEIKKPKRKKAI
ncbi:MAG: TfoX/Sxy family protein [Saprospiraceae bacterium]|nr:TfoX/Sxy family protein [Saprospiraceae bacterium]MCF8250460.1 TfoX/Sxy family protein [Saprospiraceae bacterium]MCF8282762.1 TfoX/Sxy family protein [Bacteroidales bacterium]MCF8312394.1 TfoX/Sxy family protein [Saprospiraceae bacterium]MCF8440609.1 TfoX/Sxy family protein [Saprospiraceae bacterium]